MTSSLQNKIVAVVRVRGNIGVRQSIKETLHRLNLNRVNNLVILQGNGSNIGMIKKCTDFVTYGEIDKGTLEGFLKRKGIKATKEEVEEMASGRKRIVDLVAMPIRMHPPRHGYEGIKVNFSKGGALGYRGAEISKLMNRMA